jgi:hypothetical protein
MRAYGWFLGCSICIGLSGPVRAQQPVSFADLQGAVIHTRVLFQQEGLSNGQPFQNQAEAVSTITIDSTNTLTNTVVSTAYNPRGIRTSPPRSGSFTLGQPREISSAGGGNAMWSFQDGKLVNIRSFKAGAYRARFHSAAAPTAFDAHCTLPMPAKPELLTGIGYPQSQAPISG